MTSIERGATGAGSNFTVWQAPVVLRPHLDAPHIIEVSLSDMEKHAWSQCTTPLPKGLICEIP